MSKLKNYKDVNHHDIKAILKSFFGTSYAASIVINDKVVELVWEMLSKTEECTKLLDLVPRPSGFIPSSSYIAKQLSGVVKRILTQKPETIAYICKKASAYGYSTKIKMASSNL